MAGAAGAVLYVTPPPRCSAAASRPSPRRAAPMPSTHGASTPTAGARQALARRMTTGRGVSSLRLPRVAVCPPSNSDPPESAIPDLAGLSDFVAQVRAGPQRLGCSCLGLGSPSCAYPLSCAGRRADARRTSPRALIGVGLHVRVPGGLQPCDQRRRHRHGPGCGHSMMGGMEGGCVCVCVCVCVCSTASSSKAWLVPTGLPS